MREAFKKNNPAFVLGLFETGLGVIRSLGQNGIKVYGFDYKKDIGYYSKYSSSYILPEPKTNTFSFSEKLFKKAKESRHKPVLYITSDDYLEFIIKNYESVNKYFLHSFFSLDSLKFSLNKKELHNLNYANIPETYSIDEPDKIKYPVILKGGNVNSWRTKYNYNKKVVLINDYESLKINYEKFSKLGIEVIIQEIIEGGDDNFYKYTAYADKSGNILYYFMLQKIHQNPIHYGVGCLVKSIYRNDLKTEGEKFFKIADLKGLHSIEFKYDHNDKRFKLIEVNSRYWQQNYLATVCGVNFPVNEYLHLTNQYSPDNNLYESGIYWVNIYMELKSYLEYLKNKENPNFELTDLLKSKIVFSDFNSKDIKPSFYEYCYSGKYKKYLKLF